MKNLLVSLVLLLTAACSSASGDRYTEHSDPHQGTIVFYRTPGLLQQNFNIEMDGKEACALQPSGFSIMYANGETEVAVTKWDTPGTSRLKISIKPNQIKYVRIDLDSDKRTAQVALGFIGSFLAEEVSDKNGPFELQLVAATVAKRELADLREDCQSK